MIRQIGPGRMAIFALAMGLSAGLAALPASAQDHRSRSASPSKPATGSKASAKPDGKASNARGKAAEAAKPGLLETYGDWAAYAAGSGKSKTCYALGQPQDRKPELKRDPAFLFVSTRPGESVRNEVSFVMGFEVKPESTPTAQIGSSSFELVAKGANLWLKNPASEGQFVDTMRRGSRLIVKAPSKRGNSTTDSYSLSGLAQALDRVRKECP